jgi:hypothetical protein
MMFFSTYLKVPRLAKQCQPVVRVLWFDQKGGDPHINTVQLVNQEAKNDRCS